MSGWYICTADSEFAHHGIQGMRWGVRRYQNADGTLTEEGKRRYLGDSRRTEKLRNKLEKTALEPDSPKKVLRQATLQNKLRRSVEKDERNSNYRYAMDQYRLRDRVKDHFQYGLIGASKVKKYLGYSGKSLQEARDLMDREREYKQYDKEVKRLRRDSRKEKWKSGYDSYKDNLHTTGKDYTGARRLADAMQKGRRYSKQVLNAVGYKNMSYSDAMAFAAGRNEFERERKEAQKAWKG